MYRGFGVRVLVVEEQALAREAIREFLSVSPDVQELYTAGDGREAVDAVGAHRPDVMVIDVRLPDESGLQIARRVRRLYPATAVVLLADHDNPQYREAAVACGASAFVAKQEIAGQLMSAICLAAGSGSRDSLSSVVGRDAPAETD